jgi:hypothetical protein
MDNNVLSAAMMSIFLFFVLINADSKVAFFNGKIFFSRSSALWID